MSANFEIKKQVVEEIKEKINNSKSIVLVSFNGLTVGEDTELRSEFRKNGVEYKVLKNTLVRKAFNDLGVKDFDDDLNGPTSVAFGSDETGASKVVFEATKKYADKVSIKSGFVNNAKIDVNGVKALAAIPSREQLLSILVGTLSGFPRGLAVALNRVAEQKA
ncbi:MAG: 50S ribosomal protein L10 [Clostridiales bacterium]|nr:50S ribosomal protein L10 [Clostridiales bacterium]